MVLHIRHDCAGGDNRRGVLQGGVHSVLRSWSAKARRLNGFGFYVILRNQFVCVSLCLLGRAREMVRKMIATEHSELVRTNEY